MSVNQLTPAQHAILAKAINTSGGKIEWFPDHIKGGARKKVLDSLFNRALITPEGQDWCVADDGYDALGMKRPAASQSLPQADHELEQIVTAAEAAWRQQPEAVPAIAPAVRVAACPRTRASSKQAEVVRMLHRPDGATIGQISAATGWQAHTVRGAFAGAFKKKLGLAITSAKIKGSERIYRVV